MGGFTSFAPGKEGGADVSGPKGAAFDAPAPSPSAPSAAGFQSGLSSGGLSLSAPVGAGAANRPGDVFRVESVLAGADMLARAPGRVFKEDPGNAIRTAQARLNGDRRIYQGQPPLRN